MKDTDQCIELLMYHMGRMAAMSFNHIPLNTIRVWHIKHHCGGDMETEEDNSDWLCYECNKTLLSIFWSSKTRIKHGSHGSVLA